MPGKSEYCCCVSRGYARGATVHEWSSAVQPLCASPSLAYTILPEEPVPLKQEAQACRQPRYLQAAEVGGVRVVLVLALPAPHAINYQHIK
jgi:hypothetical protein